MGSELELQVSGVAPGRYRVSVVNAPAGGTPASDVQLDVAELLRRRPDIERTMLASAVPARRVTSLLEEPVRRIGQELFEAVFVGLVGSAYRASLGAVQNQHQRLRISLRLEAPELAQLPWETLFDPEQGIYLCRQEPLVRYVTKDGAEPLKVRRPLRILAVISSPGDLPALDTEAEKSNLTRALTHQLRSGGVELIWLPEATWADLQDYLHGGVWHVLHFIGHGSYDSQADEGLIALVNENGRKHLIKASQLADLLGLAQPPPRLVVLNSCSSAETGGNDVLSSTGATLVHGGIHAVAAMQFAVSDGAAVRFARGFYYALASGRRVDEAVQSGRLAILGAPDVDTLEWVTPVLFVRREATRLFDIADVPPFAHESGPHRHLSAAEAAMRAGRYDEALRLLDELLAEDPDQAEAAALRDEARQARSLASRYQRARQAEDAGHWAQAIEAYTEVLAIRPDYRDTSARREHCRTRLRVSDLQADARHSARAGDWRAVVLLTEELRRLDPAAVDTDQEATARQSLAAAARCSPVYHHGGSHR